MSKSWFGGTLSEAPGVLKSLSSSKFSHYHSGQPIHSLLSLHRDGNFIGVIDVNQHIDLLAFFHSVRLYPASMSSLSIVPSEFGIRKILLHNR